MKKKFVAIIVAGTVSLLLGGIVYCGISAFPELLKEDLEGENVAEANNAAQEHHVTHYVADVEIEVAEEKAEAPVITAATVSESKVAAFSVDDKGFEGFVTVDSASTIKEIIISSGLSHFVDESLFETISFVEIEQPIIEEIVTQKVEHVSHHIEEKNDEPVIKAKTVNSKAVANTNNSSSSKATIECSLLVIGAVDIISILLVRHKKRHLLR